MNNPVRIRPPHEFDWVLPSTQSILQALSQILRDNERHLRSAQEEYQVDDALELAENTLGLAFVVAQTYVTGTIGMINRMARLAPGISKADSLKAFGQPVGATGVTDVQLCDSIANYYKHHDEWHALSERGPHTKTLSVLRAAGIDEMDPYVCVQAGELLFLGHDPDYSSTLLWMLTQWRVRQIEALARPGEGKQEQQRGA